MSRVAIWRRHLRTVQQKITLTQWSRIVDVCLSIFTFLTRFKVYWQACTNFFSFKGSSLLYWTIAMCKEYLCWQHWMSANVWGIDCDQLLKSRQSKGSWKVHLTCWQRLWQLQNICQIPSLNQRWLNWTIFYQRKAVQISDHAWNNKLRLVRIYFDTPTFDRIIKDRSAKFVDMLSAIGGSMGLLTGFSIISAVEIIYFATKIIFGCTKNK